MENFRDIARLFPEARACLQVRNAEELAEILLKLFGDPTAAEQWGRRGKKVLEGQTGATERVLKQIERLLETVPLPEGSKSGAR
jgi:3-deoxy-D-manno-octulosonic-acid transferase